MLPSRVTIYMSKALAGTPDVLERLLQGIPDSASVWDIRPDPERFTLREILAHLADWEPIFLDRLIRTRNEDKPTLQGYDEGQVALDNDYAHQSPRANLARFRAGRENLIAFLNTLSEADWARVGLHTEIGPITLEAHATLILSHDGYHTRQVAQWLASGK